MHCCVVLSDLVICNCGISSQHTRLLLLWLVFKACQTSSSAPVVFKWSISISLTSRQPTLIYHMTGCSIWPWIQLLCVICGSKNGTSGCHLVVYIVNVAHFVALHSPPPTLYKCLVLVMPVVTVSKMVGNSATVAIHSTVGVQIDYDYSYRNCSELHASICFPS